jgi:hypothetical protein
MLVAHLAFFVQEHQGRHASQFEQVDFLPISICNDMLRVRQANVRDFLNLPVTLERFGAIRANGDDFRVTRGKGGILVAQGGKMGATIGSHKAA